MYICFYCFWYCFCHCLPDFTLGVSDIYRKLRMCIDHVLKAEHSMASFRPPRHCPHLAGFFFGAVSCLLCERTLSLFIGYLTSPHSPPTISPQWYAGCDGKEERSLLPPCALRANRGEWKKPNSNGPENYPRLRQPETQTTFCDATNGFPAK